MIHTRKLNFGLQATPWSFEFQFHTCVERNALYLLLIPLMSQFLQVTWHERWGRPSFCRKKSHLSVKSNGWGGDRIPAVSLHILNRHVRMKYHRTHSTPLDRGLPRRLVSTASQIWHGVRFSVVLVPEILVISSYDPALLHLNDVEPTFQDRYPLQSRMASIALGHSDLQMKRYTHFLSPLSPVSTLVLRNVEIRPQYCQLWTDPWWLRRWI